MRKLIYWFLGAVTFIFVVTSNIWKQAISLSLCGILGFNSVTCHGWFLDGRVNAAVPKSGVEIAEVDIFKKPGGDNNNPNNDIFSNPDLKISPQVPQTINNQPTSSSNDTENAEPICTCWFSEEQAAGKVWDCRLWGKMNGWGWWWFHPHGGQPSPTPPDEVQKGECKVTNGQKELEEQRLNVNQPPRGIKP